MSISPSIWSAAPRLALGTERARRGSSWIKVANLQGPGTTYDPDAASLFARMTVQPDDTRKALTNNLITSLKSAGLWDKLDCLWLMAAHDAQAARLNWKSAAFTLTPVAAPSFTADRGYTFDGASSFLKTGYIPNTHGVAYQLNTGHMSTYSKSTGINGGGTIGGRTTSTVDQALLLPRNGGTFSGRINQNINPTGITVSDSSGHFTASRVDASTIRLSRNGSMLGVSSAAVTNKPQYELYIGGINQSDTLALPTAQLLSAATVGDYLSDADNTALYVLLRDYQAAMP